MFQIPIADPSLAHRSLPRQKIPCKLEKQFQNILIFTLSEGSFVKIKIHWNCLDKIHLRGFKFFFPSRRSSTNHGTWNERGDIHRGPQAASGPGPLRATVRRPAELCVRGRRKHCRLPLLPGIRSFFEQNSTQWGSISVDPEPNWPSKMIALSPTDNNEYAPRNLWNQLNCTHFALLCRHRHWSHWSFLGRQPEDDSFSFLSNCGPKFSHLARLYTQWRPSKSVVS